MGEVIRLDAAQSKPTTFKIGRDTLKMLNYATEQELGLAEQSIGYSARVWAQVSLPYRDPGPTPYWERKNGDVALTMRPALLSHADGTRYEAYAYGILPRHALTWLSTEAVKTQQPVIELGSSMSSFMEKIGLSHGGRDANRLTEQLRRLFGSQLSVQGLAVTEGGRGEFTQYFQIANKVQLWFSDNDAIAENNTGLWSSQVTLSEEFFRSIVESPVPIDINATKALGSSPMRYDIYTWSTHRVFTLSRETRIKWEDLNKQFGAQYKNLRAFKAAFIRNLEVICKIYPELNVRPEKDYLVLYPSRPHVRPINRRKELI